MESSHTAMAKKNLWVFFYCIIIQFLWHYRYVLWYHIWSAECMNVCGYVGLRILKYSREYRSVIKACIVDLNRQLGIYELWILPVSNNTVVSQLCNFSLLYIRDSGCSFIVKTIDFQLSLISVKASGQNCFHPPGTLTVQIQNLSGVHNTKKHHSVVTANYGRVNLRMLATAVEMTFSNLCFSWFIFYDLFCVIPRFSIDRVWFHFCCAQYCWLYIRI